MMDQPSKYFIEYESAPLYARELARCQGVCEAVDPARTYVREEAKTRLAGYSMARRAGRLNATTVYLKRRVGIRDDTPADFPVRAYFWTWDDEETVAEIG